MKKSDKRVVDRRKFLKGAAVGGMATLVASTGTLRAQQTIEAKASIPPVPPREADPPAKSAC